jgi:hypothetical protein
MIEWDDASNILVSVTVAELTRFFAEHPIETIRAFGYTIEGYDGDVLLSLDSYAWRKAQDEKHGGFPALEKLGYRDPHCVNTGDWEFPALRYLSPEWDPFSARIQRALRETDERGERRIYRELAECCVVSLERLIRGGCFKPRTAELSYTVIEVDEWPKAGEKRMKYFDRIKRKCR